MRRILRLIESIAMILLSAAILMGSIFAMRSSLRHERTEYDRAQIVFDPALFAQRDVNDAILVDALAQKENLIYEMDDTSIFALNGFLTKFSEQGFDVISRMDQKRMAEFAARYHQLYEDGGDYVPLNTINRIVDEFFHDSVWQDALIGSEKFSVIDGQILMPKKNTVYNEIAVLTAFYDNQDGTINADFDIYRVINADRVSEADINITNAQAIQNPGLTYLRSGKAQLEKAGESYYLMKYTSVVEGYCGHDIWWQYDQMGHKLSFVGTGKMDNYSEWGGLPPWHLYASNIETVEIDDRITTIGDYAFYEFQNLRKFDCPSALISIGNSAFNGCRILNQIVFSPNLEVIHDYAFYGCAALREVEFPESLEKIWMRAFNECDSLTTVSIPKNVESADEYVFAFCDNLKGIFVDPKNPHYASDEYGVFFDREMKTLLLFPCGIMSDYIVPDGVEIIEQYAFQEAKLTSVTLSDSVTTIERGAFMDCRNLSSVYLGRDFVNLRPDAFLGAYELSYFDLSPENQHFSIDENGVLFNSDRTILCQYPKTNFEKYFVPDSVSKIAKGAFTSCRFLSALDLNHASILEEDAFSDCSALTEITFADGTYIIPSRCFYNCINLKTITMPASIGRIDRLAFLGCERLESAYFWGDCPKISEEAFVLSFDVERQATLYYSENTDGWDNIDIPDVKILPWNHK